MTGLMQGLMYEIILGLYILSFSLGVVAVTVSLLANQRFSNNLFVMVALVFVASLLLIMADFVGLRALVRPALFGGSIFALSLVFTTVGNALFAYSLIRLVFRLVGTDAPSPLLIVLSTAALAVLGALDDLVPGPVTALTDQIGLSALGFTCIGVVAWRMDRVGVVVHKSFLRYGLVACFAMTFLCLAQRVWQVLPHHPAGVSDLPITDLVYCLVASGLLLIWAFRYLFKTDLGGDPGIDPAAATEFGISPRELEIVSLMA
ncbi:MAG TPA: hypothetical protein VFH83_14850, partial [Spirochaetia bacterium]|nr:hypothetical protein [Spirochaetia bacterium]